MVSPTASCFTMQNEPVEINKTRVFLMNKNTNTTFTSPIYKLIIFKTTPFVSLKGKMPSPKFKIYLSFLSSLFSTLLGPTNVS